MLSLKSGEIMIFFPLLAIFRALSLLLSNTRIKIQKKKNFWIKIKLFKLKELQRERERNVRGWKITCY